MKAWLTYHVEADVCLDATTPCARCKGMTVLVPGPAGDMVQSDILGVERTGDKEFPLRLDVARHDCARWRSAAGRARMAVLAVIRLGEARDQPPAAGGAGGGA